MTVVQFGFCFHLMIYCCLKNKALSLETACFQLQKFYMRWGRIFFTSLPMFTDAKVAVNIRTLKENRISAVNHNYHFY